MKEILPEPVIYSFVGILLTALLGSVLTRDHRRRAVKETERQKYMSAVYAAIGSVRDKPHLTLIDMAEIENSVSKVELACRNYRIFLNKRHRIAFDQSIQAYCKACLEDIPNWRVRKEAAAALFTGQELVTPEKIFKTHIDKLFSFADFQ